MKSSSKGYILLSLIVVPTIIYSQERILINKSPIAITVSWNEEVRRGSSRSSHVIKHEIPPQGKVPVVLGQIGRFQGNAKASYKPSAAYPFVYETPIELQRNITIAFNTVPLTEILKRTQSLIIFYGNAEGKFSNFQYRTPPLNKIFHRAGRISELGK